MTVKLLNCIPNYICGNIITISDLAIELSKYIDIKLYCQSDYTISNIGEQQYIARHQYDNWFKALKIIHKYMYVKDFLLYDNNSISRDDVLISTMWHVIVKSDYFSFFNISAKTLILLDSLDVYTLYLDNKLEDILNVLSSQYNNIYLLANPFNVKIYKTIKNISKNIVILEYYTKLSADRILELGKNIKHDAILLKSEVLSNKYIDYYVYDDHNKFINTLEYKGFSYCRHYKINSTYIENIGKILLEYIVLGRKADYYTLNKCIDDGLHYYLSLLGIDDDINNIDINIDKELVYKNIVFNDNDLILKILNND